jgi:hypothetical protein
MKVRLKIVSKFPEVSRAEQQVMRCELEVGELQQQLVEAQEKLRRAKERVQSFKSKTNIPDKVGKSGKRPITLQRVDPEAQLDYNLREFEKNPTKRTAKLSLAVARKVERWDPLAVTGLFLEQYAQRYRRDWKGTTHGLQTLFREMKKLFERVGDEAETAVIAVFSPKMKWVDNQVGLLLSTDAYERFIVPAMDAVRRDRKGEGSEWSGSRDEVGGCEEVDL